MGAWRRAEIARAREQRRGAVAAEVKPRSRVAGEGRRRLLGHGRQRHGSLPFPPFPSLSLPFPLFLCEIPRLLSSLDSYPPPQNFLALDTYLTESSDSWLVSGD